MTAHNPYAAYRNDPALETGGVWMEEPYFRVKVRRAGGANKRFAKTQERILKPVRRLAEQGNLPDDIARQKMAEIYTEAIIVAWETRDDPMSTEWVTDTIYDPDQGEVVEYDEDVGRRALLAAPEFFDLMVGITTTANNYREQLDSDLGN